ncbi:hypothetical protein BH09PAT1_BH09PAT1_8700 [soil metagenome]
MLPEYFVYIGVIITALGGISYLIDTIKGKVQPNRVTWVLWALAPWITFFAQRVQSVGSQSLLPLSIGFIPTLIVAASFLNKKAKWEIHRFDLICGGLSILGLILWLITRAGDIAIIFSILADFLATIPTLRKAHLSPETESFKAYFLNMLGAGIVVLAIHDWRFANAAFSVYFLLNTVLILTFLKFRFGKKSSS